MRLCVKYIGFLSIFAAAQAHADSRFSMGIEGLHDHYQEQDATVNISTWYGSVTGSYEYTNNGFFTAVDGRYTQGKEDYSSVSGKLDDEHSFETDDRVRFGLDIPTAMWHGHLMPYIGVGWRYYLDEGKGLRTDTNHIAYDRHISQFYIPVGSTYRFTSGDWNFAPNIEADLLASGEVNTHLAPIGIDQNITNKQRAGWGVRGEFMAGQQYKNFGWEAGPFVRYWKISDSNCVTTAISAPDCRLEPANTRLQTGAALRVNF